VCHWNAVNSCHVASRRQRRSRTGGARRTFRYPPDRCLACQRRLDADATVQEATLTIYEPRAVVTIRFRVCQPCALNLDPHADAPRLLSRLVIWCPGALRLLPRHA
jgi:hypothetical protein